MQRERFKVNLHLRLTESFTNELVKIANENNLKPAQMARIVLERTIPNYSRNRFWNVY
jgi:hypothetical protein